MLISRRRFAAAALSAIPGCLPISLRASRSRPKLFIFLVAEQFRQVYLDRTDRQLGKRGFRRLMEEGIYYPNCRLASSSFTSTGLATLSTGAYPQLHGIVADQWYDRKTHAPAHARGEALEATRLADEVERLGARSRVFCIGLDAAHASLLAGGPRTQVLWMDAKGQFTTRNGSPDWLGVYNTNHPIEKLQNEKWLAVGNEDQQRPPLRTLTYDAQHPEEFLALYRASPFAQDAQFDVLLQMLESEGIGQRDTLDFVFVSLGSLALLGYETGSDSPLMDQMVLKLDLQIQATLEALDKKVGAGKYNLIFAAAHGAPALPPPAQARKAIAGENLARAIDKALSDQFDTGLPKNRYVEKFVYPFVYLRAEPLRRQLLTMRAVRRLAGELALNQPGVAGYYTLDGDCSQQGAWRDRFANSFHPLRSGDVMLSYQPGVVEEYGAGRGVSYGSFYNYDSVVPLFLYGAQFGAEVFEREIDLTAVVPTVAQAAGVSVPSSTMAEALEEAFSEEKPPK
jgi:Type I phosphodiesterase / nucleotide pyrophosphatase